MAGAIGESILIDIENRGAAIFVRHGKDRPMRRGESGYINEISGIWVSDEDWDHAWADRPRWHVCAYMICGNGQWSYDEVSGMEPEEIEELHDSDEFEPEYLYWTCGE